MGGQRVERQVTVLEVQAQRAAGDAVAAVEHLEQRALADAAGPGEYQALARGESQRQVAHHLKGHAALAVKHEGLVQGVDAEKGLRQGCHGGPPHGVRTDDTSSCV